MLNYENGARYPKLQIVEILLMFQPFLSWAFLASLGFVPLMWVDIKIGCEAQCTLLGFTYNFVMRSLSIRLLVFCY